MDGLRRYSLSIADICIAFVTDQPCRIEPQFLPFLTEAEEPDIRLYFHRVPQLPPLSDRVLHEDHCYRVHPDGKDGYVRAFFDAPRDMTPYAVSKWEDDGRTLRVDYLEKGAKCISRTQNSFFHLGFESVLIRNNRLCIHAACVDTPLGGILFSGPSGIGKSTQAELWCKHRDARQINGDRPILSKSKAGWLAWGSPYAGSSRCHVNDHCPVTALIMLRQDQTCSLRRLGSSEAFRAVWSGLTMHSWDKGAVGKAFDLATELIGTVPVYEFGCIPDAASVDFLERELQKNGTKEYALPGFRQSTD